MSDRHGGKKGQTFVKGRYNKQMTYYYATTKSEKTTLTQIEEQDEGNGTEEEPDNIQRNARERMDQLREQLREMKQETGVEKGRGKMTTAQQLEKYQKKRSSRNTPYATGQINRHPPVSFQRLIVVYE